MKATISNIRTLVTNLTNNNIVTTFNEEAVKDGYYYTSKGVGQPYRQCGNLIGTSSQIMQHLIKTHNILGIQLPEFS